MDALRDSTGPAGIAVETGRYDGVARLVIDRVPKRNALNRSMWTQIPALLADLAIRVLLDLVAVGERAARGR
jgi:enoyl-CoA hydratase/carnithine racemase